MLGPLPAHGPYFRRVNRLEMSHVEDQPKTPDARPSICTDDVHRAHFAFSTTPSDPLAFSFPQSSNLRVVLSRAAPDVVVA